MEEGGRKIVLRLRGPKGRSAQDDIKIATVIFDSLLALRKAMAFRAVARNLTTTFHFVLLRMFLIVHGREGVHPFVDSRQGMSISASLSGGKL